MGNASKHVVFSIAIFRSRGGNYLNLLSFSMYWLFIVMIFVLDGFWKCDIPKSSWISWLLIFFNTKMIIRDLDDWSLPTVERNDVAEMGVPPVIIHL